MGDSPFRHPPAGGVRIRERARASRKNSKHEVLKRKTRKTRKTTPDVYIVSIGHIDALFERPNPVFEFFIASLKNPYCYCFLLHMYFFNAKNALPNTNSNKLNKTTNSPPNCWSSAKRIKGMPTNQRNNNPIIPIATANGFIFRG